MSISKYLALGLSLFMLTACSSFGGSDDEGSSGATSDQISELENKVGDRVFFDFDSSSLTGDAQEVLKRQAAFMSQNESLKFMVEGHCDERGTREYNIALGERRANSVKQYLIQLGVDSDKLTTVSYGKEKPAVEGSNDWAWSQNRRGVTVIK
jgi:peptidoglycan-associated lipoprotein